MKLAEAFGVLGIRVNENYQVAGAIEEAMAYEGPVIVDFVVDPEENVYPMIPPGESVNELIEAPEQFEAVLEANPDMMPPS